ncbi:hypothetical protein N6W67_03120 [Proteus mirabilis]|nr:hypothetical protein [Proteus mirabilis]UXJ01223.1 hypothetical protein N6W67_03120 [Proteus mirabilis]
MPNVNADELKDGVQTQVTVPGGSAAGDTLTLTITKPDGSTDDLFKNVRDIY